MLIFIDREGEETFWDFADILNRSGIRSKCFNSVIEAERYLTTSKLDDHSFFIHGSIGRSRVSFEKEGFSDTIHSLVATIHQINPFSRITIYSGAYSFPLPEAVSELQADGYVCDSLSLGQIRKLAEKGLLTVEELQQRGQTIEDIQKGVRIEGRLGHFRSTREGE